MRRLFVLAALLAPCVARADAPPSLPPPDWRIAVDAVAGNGVLFTGDRNDAHLVLGGMARVRVGVLELGGYGEWTPHEVDAATAFGALVGVFFPHRHWLDFELAGTFGARRWRNADTRYGPNGYTLVDRTAGARAGVSARAGGLFGVRVGAMLVFVSDLANTEVPWAWSADAKSQLVTTGARRVGGQDVMLLLTIGLDVTPSR